MEMKKIFRSFTLIINYKTFIITALAVLSSFVCFHLGLTAKFPDMLVGVAIVFPVVGLPIRAEKRHCSVMPILKAMLSPFTMLRAIGQQPKTIHCLRR
jgi:hypothetical protein